MRRVGSSWETNRCSGSLLHVSEVPIVLHDNLPHESHKPYGPPTSITWLQLLRKQTSTGTPLFYAHTTLRTLPTARCSYLHLKLDGYFLELIVLYHFHRSPGLTVSQCFQNQVQTIGRAESEFGLARQRKGGGNCNNNTNTSESYIF